MRKVVFSFFNNSVHTVKKSYLISFCDHFKLDYIDTYMQMNHDTKFWMTDIVSLFKLDLSLPIDDCYILCKSRGLLTLADVFTKETELKNFLLSYGIEVYPDEHYFVDAWANKENVKRYTLEFLLPLKAIEMNMDHKSLVNFKTMKNGIHIWAIIIISIYIMKYQWNFIEINT